MTTEQLGWKDIFESKRVYPLTVGELVNLSKAKDAECFLTQEEWANLARAIDELLAIRQKDTWIA